jgi:hypothetical protein
MAEPTEAVFTATAAGVSTASAVMAEPTEAVFGGLATGTSTALAQLVATDEEAFTGFAAGVSTAIANVEVLTGPTIFTGTAAGTSGAFAAFQTDEPVPPPYVAPPTLIAGISDPCAQRDTPMLNLAGINLDVPEGFTLEYTLNQSTKTVAVGVSSEVPLYGEQAQTIRRLFFSSCDDISNTIEVIYNTACGICLPFTITFEGVQYCPEDCTVSVRLQNIDARGVYDYLNDTVFWKGGWLEAAQAGEFKIPKMQYCKQPSFLLWIVRQILALLALITTLLDELDNALKGCNRYRTTPLIRQVVEWHCDKAGVAFSSSILQGDYANLVLFEALLDKGFRWRKRAEEPVYDTENSTNFTVGQLLDSLKPVFNADWRITGGTVYFERVDWFDEYPNVQLFDAVGQASCIDEQPCYEFSLDNVCAFLRLEFASDFLETEGNKTLTLWHKDLVEWNSPPNDWQRGECTQFIDYSPARFVRDRVAGTKDPDSGAISEGFEWLIDMFRAGYNVTGIPPFGESVDHAVVVSNHTAQNAKLIVLEDGYDPDDALAIRRPVSTPIGDAFGVQAYDYNYLLFCDENYEVPELYQRFHYISNPRYPSRRQYKISSLKYAPADYCRDLMLIHTDSQRLYINTEYGRGIITGSITVDGESRNITLREIKIRC